MQLSAWILNAQFVARSSYSSRSIRPPNDFTESCQRAGVHWVRDFASTRHFAMAGQEAEATKPKTAKEGEHAAENPPRRHCRRHCRRQ